MASVRAALKCSISLAKAGNVISRSLVVDTTPLVYRDPTKHRSRSESNVHVLLSKNENKVRLFCNEGEMRYHGVWLRHNCRCPKCYDYASQNTLVRPEHLETANTIIENVKIEDNIVHVSFHNHSALFPMDWLKEHSYSNMDFLKQKHKKSEPLVAKSLPVCDFNDVMESKEGLYKWLKQLNYYGCSLIQNGPAEEHTVRKVASKVGFIQESAYGEVFDVKAKENPDNLAYGHNELIFHMDLLYHESPPGIQILHCIRNDPCVEGGESTLLDAYPVVKQLEKENPHHFEVLSTVQVPHMKIEYVAEQKFDMRYATPQIILDKYGEVTGIRWNPPGQYAVNIPEDQVEDYYSAYRYLAKMFDESDLKITYLLRPGEMLTFNNRRFLHGRKSYRDNGGLRHLQGIYLSADLLRSRFIGLSNELGKSEPTKRVFINNV